MRKSRTIEPKLRHKPVRRRLAARDQATLLGMIFARIDHAAKLAETSWLIADKTPAMILQAVFRELSTDLCPARTQAQILLENLGAAPATAVQS